MAKTELAIIQKSMADRVKEMQASKEVHFPANYSYDNAMKSAWLILQETKDMNKKPALDVCSQASIANSLLQMVIQGLSPAKKQCYFMVKGGKLCMTRSYFGTIAVTKRLKGVEDVWAQVVFEGDDFEYTIERGVKKIVKHVQSMDNIDTTKIRGAYATIIHNDQEFTEIMNWKQIQKAWGQSSSKSQTVHKGFPEEMAKRTVINRACKMFANVSDDSDLLIEAMNATTANEYENDDVVEIGESVVAEIAEHQASETIGFEEPEEEPEMIVEEEQDGLPFGDEESEKPEPVDTSGTPF